MPSFGVILKMPVRCPGRCRDRLENAVLPRRAHLTLGPLGETSKRCQSAGSVSGTAALNPVVKFLAKAAKSVRLAISCE